MQTDIMCKKRFFMCCQRIRIYLLVFTTALSLGLHVIMPEILAFAWYFLFINIFTAIFYTIILSRLKKGIETPTENLYYFSLMGGVVGGVLALILFKFPTLTRRFYLTFCIFFIFWGVVFGYFYTNFI